MGQQKRAATTYGTHPSTTFAWAQHLHHQRTAVVVVVVAEDDGGGDGVVVVEAGKIVAAFVFVAPASHRFANRV